MSRYGGKRKKYLGSVPDRWLGCPRKSVQLFFDKFLVFKTPLSHKYNDQVPDECLWPVDFVFNSMKSYKLKLGLWIDLTFTNRFYDREDVERHDCKYVKLQCRGFGQTPSVEQTQTFNEICYNFIRQHPLEIIGVHCTHGFNRSGFMLVSFLVEKYDWELRAALLKFAEIRPPGIYKKDYIVELYKRYEEDECAPEAPPLPDWCFDERGDENNDDDDDDNVNNEDGDEDDDEEEEEDNDDDKSKDGNNFDGSSRKRKIGNSDGSKKKSKKRKKEFVNKNPVFMKGVPNVTPVTGPELERIQRRVQDMCDWKESGFPGSQPVSMTKANMELLSSDYAVSWKADGFRYLMYIEEKDKIYFIDRDNCVFIVEHISFPYRKNLNQHIKKTLLDGEMVIDKVNGQKIPRYLVYDIITLNNYLISKQNFMPTRYEAIKCELIDPRHKAMQLGLINKAKEPFSIRRKEFSHVKDAGKFLSEKFCQALAHEPDGLIFQPAKGPYVPGRCDALLKWKPPSLNSIDFKLKITTEKGIGIVPKKIGELYVNGLSTKFGVLKSLKNVKDLNNKIIECKYENGGWVFMRERTDKSFPNAYETAVNVLNSILNPVTKEMLLGFIDTSIVFKPPPLPPPPVPHSSHR